MADQWHPAGKIWVTVSTLGQLQGFKGRDLGEEIEVAKEANVFLHIRDNHDFMLCARVLVSDAWKTECSPKAWIMMGSHLARYVRCSEGERPWLPQRLAIADRHALDTYFYGFYRGDHLGYLNDFGSSWYIVMGDSGGFWYVPIGALEHIESCFF